MNITSKVETFPLDLPGPTVPLAEQIRLGNYTYSNPALTKPGNFSLTVPAGPREVVLYDPQGPISSEEMIARMKQDGFRPAMLDDVLAFGVQHPERQRRNPIVFLGTVWADGYGRRRVPVLIDWDGGRKLVLLWFGGGWVSYSRFAAVRES